MAVPGRENLKFLSRQKNGIKAAASRRIVCRARHHAASQQFAQIGSNENSATYRRALD
jgi:hypothetical protein